jgi:hypothetical protein
MPSLKNSFSASALRLTKGRTASAAMRETGWVEPGVGVPYASSCSAAPRAMASSAALWSRCSRHCASARATRLSIPSGTGTPADRTVGAAEVQRAMSSATGLRPGNGGWPTSISYSTQPREYTSLRPSSGSSPACSGLM